MDLNFILISEKANNLLILISVSFVLLISFATSSIIFDIYAQSSANGGNANGGTNSIGMGGLQCLAANSCQIILGQANGGSSNGGTSMSGNIPLGTTSGETNGITSTESGSSTTNIKPFSSNPFTSDSSSIGSSKSNTVSPLALPPLSEIVTNPLSNDDDGSNTTNIKPFSSNPFTSDSSSIGSSKSTKSPIFIKPSYKRFAHSNDGHSTNSLTIGGSNSDNINSNQLDDAQASWQQFNEIQKAISNSTNNSKHETDKAVYSKLKV